MNKQIKPIAKAEPNAAETDAMVQQSLGYYNEVEVYVSFSDEAKAETQAMLDIDDKPEEDPVSA